MITFPMQLRVLIFPVGNETISFESCQNNTQITTEEARDHCWDLSVSDFKNVGEQIDIDANRVSHFTPKAMPTYHPNTQSLPTNRILQMKIIPKCLLGDGFQRPIHDMNRNDYSHQVGENCFPDSINLLRKLSGAKNTKDIRREICDFMTDRRNSTAIFQCSQFLHYVTQKFKTIDNYISELRKPETMMGIGSVYSAFQLFGPFSVLVDMGEYVVNVCPAQTKKSVFDEDYAVLYSPDHFEVVKVTPNFRRLNDRAEYSLYSFNWDILSHLNYLVGGSERPKKNGEKKKDDDSGRKTSSLRIPTSSPMESRSEDVSRPETSQGRGQNNEMIHRRTSDRLLDKKRRCQIVGPNNEPTRNGEFISSLPLEIERGIIVLKGFMLGFLPEASLLASIIENGPIFHVDSGSVENVRTRMEYCEHGSEQIAEYLTVLDILQELGQEQRSGFRLSEICTKKKVLEKAFRAMMDTFDSIMSSIGQKYPIGVCAPCRRDTETITLLRHLIVVGSVFMGNIAHVTKIKPTSSTTVPAVKDFDTEKTAILTYQCNENIGRELEGPDGENRLIERMVRFLEKMKIGRVSKCHLERSSNSSILHLYVEFEKRSEAELCVRLNFGTSDPKSGVGIPWTIPFDGSSFSYTAIGHCVFKDPRVEVRLGKGQLVTDSTTPLDPQLVCPSESWIVFSNDLVIKKSEDGDRWVRLLHGCTLVSDPEFLELVVMSLFEVNVLDGVLVYTVAGHHFTTVPSFNQRTRRRIKRFRMCWIGNQSSTSESGSHGFLDSIENSDLEGIRKKQGEMQKCWEELCRLSSDCTRKTWHTPHPRDSFNGQCPFFQRWKRISSICSATSLEFTGVARVGTGEAKYKKIRETVHNLFEPSLGICLEERKLYRKRKKILSKEELRRINERYKTQRYSIIMERQARKRLEIREIQLKVFQLSNYSIHFFRRRDAVFHPIVSDQDFRYVPTDTPYMLGEGGEKMRLEQIFPSWKEQEVLQFILPLIVSLNV